MAEVLTDRRLKSSLSTQQRLELSAQIQNGQTLGGAENTVQVTTPQVLRNLRNPVTEALHSASQEAGLKILKSESRIEREGRQTPPTGGNGQQGNWLTNMFNRNDQNRDEKDQPTSPKSTTSSKSIPVPPVKAPTAFMAPSKIQSTSKVIDL